MKTLVTISILFLGLVCGCQSHKTEIAPDDYVPLSFKAYIGGFTGSSYTVEMISPSRIRYTSREGREKKSMEMDVAIQSWKDFRSGLEKARVFRWKRKYIDKDVFDGTQWLLQIKYRDIETEIHGSNAYPKEENFDIFLSSVSELASRKTFK